MEHGIQNIFAEGSVEPFDVRILRGLARLDVSQTDAVSLCPDFQPIRDQFGAIVHPDLFGKAPPQQHISRIRITRSAGREVSTSIHKASRLKSPKILKVRKALPLARLSLIRSNDQLCLASAGCPSTCAFLAGTRFFGLRRKFRAKAQ